MFKELNIVPRVKRKRVEDKPDVFHINSNIQWIILSIKISVTYNNKTIESINANDIRFDGQHETYCDAFANKKWLEKFLGFIVWKDEILFHVCVLTYLTTHERSKSR